MKKWKIRRIEEVDWGKLKDIGGKDKYRKWWKKKKKMKDGLIWKIKKD